MPECRRWRVPGGTYFVTFNVLERHIGALREAVRRTRGRSFHIDA
jgi:putative transposase